MTFSDFYLHTEGLKDWVAAGILATSPITKEPVEAAPTTNIVQTISPSFVKYIAHVENGIGRGWTGKLWLPHYSAEGGAKTIAFGHKILPFESFDTGITHDQAVKLLVKDLQNASTQTEKYIIKKYGEKSWKRMTTSQREMLTDFTFNGGIGSLHKFKKFTAAVVNNDRRAIAANYKRFYTDPKTKKNLPLKTRNEAFRKQFLEH